MKSPYVNKTLLLDFKICDLKRKKPTTFLKFINSEGDNIIPLSSLLMKTTYSLKKLVSMMKYVKQTYFLCFPPALWDNILVRMGFSKRPRGVKYPTSIGFWTDMDVSVPLFPRESVGPCLLQLPFPHWGLTAVT